MNQSLEALMGSMRRALQDEILPELDSDHARSQLAGVLDVLGKIESMVVWSPEVTREQLELIEACLAEAATRIDAGGYDAPDGVAPSTSVTPLTQAALETALADAECRFAILTDWVFALNEPLASDLHDLLGTTLRNTLKAQRRLVPSADFSSMTAPRTSAGAQGDSP